MVEVIEKNKAFFLKFIRKKREEDLLFKKIQKGENLTLFSCTFQNACGQPFDPLPPEGLDSNQRWANSVLMTEYEYEYYSAFQK